MRQQLGLSFLTVFSYLTPTCENTPTDRNISATHYYSLNLICVCDSAVHHCIMPITGTSPDHNKYPRACHAYRGSIEQDPFPTITSTLIHWNGPAKPSTSSTDQHSGCLIPI